MKGEAGESTAEENKRDERAKLREQGAAVSIASSRCQDQDTRDRYKYMQERNWSTHQAARAV